MASFELTRFFDAPLDRVWGVLGNLGVSPGPGVEVEVDRPGAADGTGLVRTLKLGRVGAFQEEFTVVDPHHRVEYRMLKGAPVREYKGIVTFDATPDGRTRVKYVVTYRPVVPGTAWLISRVSQRTISRVLDIVDGALREPA